MSPLADVLRRRDDILQRWAERARGSLCEPGSTPVLLDSLPQLVDQLAAALDSGSPDRGAATSAIAVQHGAQRSLLGIDLDQLVLEYRLLRQVVVEVARESGDVRAEDVLALSDLLIDGAAAALRSWSEASQRALRHSAELLELGDGFLEIDRDWRVVRVNANQERLSGKSRRDTLGRVLWDLWPETAQPGNRYWDEYHRVMQERVPREFDAYFPPLDLWTAVTAYPIADGGIAVFFRDATGRKRAERELAETLALLEGIWSRSPVGLAFVDTSLRYVRMNEALAAMRGLDAEAVAGRTVREVIGPDLAGVLEPLYGEVIATAEPRLDVEFSAVAPSGERRHYVSNFFPVRRRGGDHVFMVGVIVVDITRRKDDEEQLRRAREFEQQLIGIVSHDLRSPLSAILLGATALLSKEDLPDRHGRAVARIRNSGERATRLINDLLDLTRARLTGSLPVEPRPTDLGAVVGETLDELRPAFADREITVERRGALEGTWDADRLAQVASNLVTNALKYGRPDRPVRVVLDGRAPDAVVLRVHNEGEPIRPELLAHLFEPWQRAQPSGAAAQGVGLGLSIVEQIVAAHGGRVAATSSEQDGTTLEVTLPRVCAERRAT